MNILILHGWGHNKKLWKNFADKFHGHTVWTLDLPGFGDQELISRTWRVEDYANWVITQIKNKKIKNIVLVGHSFGGKIAAMVAILEPQLVAKLVLVAAPLIRRPSLITLIKIQIYKTAKPYLPQKLKKLLFRLEYTDAQEQNLEEIFKNSVNFDMTHLLSKLKLPTLIIWGDKDKTTPLSIGKQMHQLIKNSQLQVINGGKHNLHFSNVHILFGLVNKFLNQN